MKYGADNAPLGHDPVGTFLSLSSEVESPETVVHEVSGKGVLKPGMFSCSWLRAVTSVLMPLI